MGAEVLRIPNKILCRISFFYCRGSKEISIGCRETEVERMFWYDGKNNSMFVYWREWICREKTWWFGARGENCCSNATQQARGGQEGMESSAYVEWLALEKWYLLNKNTYKIDPKKQKKRKMKKPTVNLTLSYY